jgi:glycosyltransferase involved in cell wall biosynthesis
MVITDLEVGGVPLHVLRLAPALPRDRFEVRVISLAGLGPVGERLRDAGIIVDACDATGPADVRALARLAGHMRRFRPDVVQALLFHASVAARTVAPLAGIPPRRVICEIQTVERERRWHLTVDGLTCRWCRCVVGNSESVVAHLRREAHIPRARLQCIPGGVDVATFAAARPLDRAPLGVADDESIVLWVGRLDPVKGLDELIEATAALRDKHHVRLLLAGTGAYEQHVRSVIRCLDAGSFVHLLGRRDDIPQLLATADVFALPSHTEGLPNALMEAMAAGRAVVATDIPGCRDLIAHEQTGLLVPPRDPQALAEAMGRLLADADARRTLGHTAQMWIAHHRSWSTTVDAWIRLYESVRSSAASTIR